MRKRIYADRIPYLFILIKHLLDQMSFELSDIHLLLDLKDLVLFRLGSLRLWFNPTKAILGLELEESLRSKLYWCGLADLGSLNTLLDSLLKDADFVI